MIRRLTLVFVFILTAVAVSAQSSDLQLTRVLDGKVVPLSRMVVTKVRGPSLSRYKMDYYRSARFEASPSEERLCRAAVEQDMKGASGSQWERKALWERKAALAFMLGSVHGKNRFVSYVTQKRGRDRYEVTLIYMEGTAKSLRELETLINK